MRRIGSAARPNRIKIRHGRSVSCRRPAGSSVILWFAFGPTMVKYAAFGQLENRICLH